MSLKDQQVVFTADRAWDDTLLIEAYHDSVNFAKEELARRLALSTNKLDSPFNTLGLSCNIRIRPEHFQRGDYVRATYINGTDYEAKIVSLKGNGTCLLKYIGYNNVQEAYLSDLVTSWGKRARRSQFLQAKIKLKTSKEGEVKHDNWNLLNKSSQKCYPPKPPLPLISKNDRCERLAAMLMAWYMSGYYTGIYECCKNNERINII